MLELEGVIPHVIVDGVEQKINRPQDKEKQKDFYSGKQKMHTLKSQIVVTPEHEIKAVSAPVPGKIHDKNLSKKVKTTELLPDFTVCIMDKAYIGLDKDIPNVKRTVAPGISIESPRILLEIPEKKPKGRELF